MQDANRPSHAQKCCLHGHLERGADRLELRYGSNPVLAASCELRRFVRANYRRELRLVCDVKLGAGARAGMVPITQIGPKFAQRLYDNLLVGPIAKKRLTQAATCVRRVSRAAHGTR